jgi:hypothetical protein
MILNFVPFSFQKTLIIALIGALIGQILSWLLTWVKRKIDLMRKKNMIINDLKTQNKVLDKTNTKYLELKELFEKKETNLFTTSTFHSLNSDIYNSVPKNELYLMFDEKLNDLVDIYNSIEFIKNNGPHYIYTNYLRKTESHLAEKKNQTNHEFYCSTHLSLIDITVQNIDNHIDSIRQIKSDIKKIIA